MYHLIYLLSCAFLSTTACNSPNKSATVENSETTSLNLKENVTKDDAPRIDSVLEFTSMITAIHEDRKGNFWFGSHHDGICRYVPSNASGKGTYTYFTVNHGLPDSRIYEFDNRETYLGNSIRTIQEGQNGSIWIGTGDGISRFNGQCFRTVFPEKESVLITESLEYGGNNAAENWQKEGNHLWFGGSNKNGGHRYDGEKLIHYTLPESANNPSKWVSTYMVYSWYKDKDGNLWFGTEGGGIMRYDGQSFTCINENEKKGIVRAFFQDTSGRIWIANNTVGLCYFDGKSLINFTEEQGLYSYSYVRNTPNAEDFKTLDGAQAIEQDRDGNLWFGTFGDGLYRYDGKQITRFTTENGLPDNTVKSIFKDKTGKLWFGIGRGTIYSFNGTIFERFDAQTTLYNQYENGKKDGFWQTVFNNGQLKSTGNYKAGQKEGLHRRWGTNGILESEGYYRKDKANGLMKWFHEGGHLAGSGDMKEGIREGPWKICDIEPNGFCIGAHFKNGLRDGLWKINHDSGKLWKEQTWKEDKVVVEKCWDEAGEEIACVGR
jgi:ligand-binding sensor domain-containing protein